MLTSTTTTSLDYNSINTLFIFRRQEASGKGIIRFPSVLIHSVKGSMQLWKYKAE